MHAIDLQAALKTLAKLEISEHTTSNDANAAMTMLGEFNQCVVGLACFSGSTPWERHPDDELLYILEGEVNVTILNQADQQQVTLHSGSIFVVPRDLWHNQHSPAGVKLLFVTSQVNNEASVAADPRNPDRT